MTYLIKFIALHRQGIPHIDVSNKILIMLWENDIINTSSLVEKIGKLHNCFIEKLNIIFFVKSYTKNLYKFLAYLFRKSILLFFKWCNAKHFK